FDGSAAIPALQPNHSYFWCVEEWRLEESGPRTSVWTAHHTRGRFAVYGDWPETPPALPGMLAYTSYHWDLGSAWEWGMSSVMQYHNDP
ncbi:MAG: hypothetical protein GTO22_24890, partial [Gemmatimonadales bacterium]|nr:hypothetical protein [Gemmatimonadales bacterium]